MQAIRVRAPGGLDKLQLEEVAGPPKPGRGELRVTIHATSLNYHDLLVAKGIIPTEDGRIPMADGAGVVESVGEGVTDFSPGDTVISCFFPQWADGAPSTPVGNFRLTPGDGVDGFAAQTVIGSESGFTRAPRGWSHTESATLPTAGLTAWRALVEDGRLKAGETVLLLGTGGVSIAALQIVKMMGARAILTSSSEEKLQRARDLGADEVINYRAQPEWGKEVKKLTGGGGVDHVLELSGPGTLEQSIHAVRVGGHISLIGVLTGQRGDVPTSLLMARQARLQGLIVGNRRQQCDYVRALEQAAVRPVIDRVYPMRELAEAFRFQESGRHFGKVCAQW